ncbi:hypothetical protein [Chryseobacterium lactis]|uniref:hypothetical protein n=1 Tax=Chryseobacterium lactis TaxID=1241981 RepID=UPI001625DB98|nr:hypothetical protein [Chryseobacterium lactis]
MFFRYIVSGSVVLAVLTLFLPKVAEINKISEVYTSPTFGLNSHNQNRIEVFEDKKAVDKKILLIGDSHALSIKPFLNYIGQKKSFLIYHSNYGWYYRIKRNKKKRD